METGRTRFAAMVTLAFGGLGGLGLARHEMWRDELQAWLIPAESGSLADLIHNLRYEGHPALWHVLLWIVTRLTRRPEAMQVLHLAISAAAVFLFVRHAPFSRPVRALFAFGYYPLYEYTVVSRNYGLGLLLLVLSCLAFPGRRRTHLPLAGALALLAGSNPYAWLIAVAFAGTLVIEALLDSEIRVGVARRPGDAALSLLLFGAAAALAAAQMMPPPDGRFAETWFLEWRNPRAFRVLATVARAWLPVPNPSEPAAWNTNVLWHLRSPVTAAVAAALLASAVASLRRSRTALLFYVSGTAALLVFTYIKYIGYARHHGAHFLLLIACLWIARPEGIEAASPRRRDLPVVLLLAVHVAAGAWVYVQDLQRPFSSAKAVAAFLRQPAYGTMPVVGYPDAMGTPVAAYLGKPLFYPQSRSLGTYVLWNDRRNLATPFREYCWILRRQLRQHRAGLLLVSAHPAPICGAWMRPEELAAFAGSLTSEDFRVYRLRMLSAR